MVFLFVLFQGKKSLEIFVNMAKISLSPLDTSSVVECDLRLRSLGSMTAMR